MYHKISDGPQPNALQKVDVPIVDNDECKKIYGNVIFSNICAGFPKGGKDSCQVLFYLFYFLKKILMY